MNLWNDIFILLVGFVSAFVGSISGGSGLIGVPPLLLLGLPPQVALGTFNFGDIGFKIGNILKFAQHKNLGVNRKDIITLTVISIPATVLGSLMVVSINTEVLSRFIGIILLVILPVMFLKKDFGTRANPAKGRRRIISHIAYFFTRVWAGFFSPGSGFIEIYVRSHLYGFTLLQGKAVTRLAFILSGIASVIVFIHSGFINYRMAIIMFVGMFFGGYIGTAFAIKKGDVWIKPIIGLIILASAIKMIFF